MAVYRFSKSRQGDNLVTKNFQVKEFACNDGTDEVFIDVDLVFKLQEIRDRFGKPVIITSGYRTPSYNARIGGASSSYHTQGRAIDFYIKGVKPYDVAHVAQGLYICGIGCYYDDGFVHIDGRKTPSFWKNQSVTRVATFDNIPSFECTARNFRLAHMADGWSFPEHGICDSYNDSEFQYVLKKSVIKKGKEYSNANKIVQYTVGASVDGIIGNYTVKKIKDWQKSHGLTADGIVGQGTWKKMLNI